MSVGQLNIHLVIHSYDKDLWSAYCLQCSSYGINYTVSKMLFQTYISSFFPFLDNLYVCYSEKGKRKKRVALSIAWQIILSKRFFYYILET